MAGSAVLGSVTGIDLGQQTSTADVTLPQFAVSSELSDASFAADTGTRVYGEWLVWKAATETEGFAARLALAPATLG